MRELIKQKLREAALDNEEHYLDLDPSKLEEVDVGQYLTHTANPAFRETIQKEGLKPHIGDSAKAKGVQRPAVYATDSPDIKDAFDQMYNDDVWRIDASKINNTWYRDPFMDDPVSVLTFEPIPPEALELVYEGMGEDQM